MVAWPCKLAGKRMLRDLSKDKLWARPFGPVVDIMPTAPRTQRTASTETPTTALDVATLLHALEEVSPTDPNATVNQDWTSRIQAGQYLSQIFVVAGCPNSDCANQGPDGPTGDGRRGLPLPVAEPTPHHRL